ncbi:DUF6241 domain-containing protein [Aquibacillus kalidii]|uniref:DUF6241 domain-containing protein n=1 Tax=Aquibacillus kalidii TaxID=2762597 RepID=UPI0016491F79|nr:DUF6241 domain-containing protein [Aquibacillus kalidii]
MYKKILAILLLFCVGLFVAFGVIIYNDFIGSGAAITKSSQASNISEKNEETEQISNESEQKMVTELSKDKLKNGDNDELNPFGDKIGLSELNDAFYQDYLHKMSHQKVVASDKWGFYLITNERINWLLDGLSKTELDHEDLYNRILTRWSEGDFTIADQDHNAVWQLQGGNIGEATGVLTEEEEKAYINSAQ